MPPSFRLCASRARWEAADLTPIFLLSTDNELNRFIGSHTEQELLHFLDQYKGQDIVNHVEQRLKTGQENLKTEKSQEKLLPQIQHIHTQPFIITQDNQSQSGNLPQNFLNFDIDEYQESEKPTEASKSIPKFKQIPKSFRKIEVQETQESDLQFETDNLSNFLLGIKSTSPSFHKPTLKQSNQGNHRGRVAH